MSDPEMIIKKPTNWSHLNCSLISYFGGISKKKSHIMPVQATSIVALDAAEAYLVTEHPKPLNKAIEKMSEIRRAIMTGL